MSDFEASTAAAAPTTVGQPDRTGPAATGQDRDAREKPRSLGTDAWRDLRRNPIFVISAILIGLLLIMAIAPGLFTDKDPRKCLGSLSRQRPRSGAIFGNDLQGCDVYARTIYGARASIVVGVMATLTTVLLGSLAGVISGFYGGFVDSVVSRLADVFFAIPLLLGSILMLTAFPNDVDTSLFAASAKVTLALAILGWPSMARIMRSSVLQVKEADYVQAARALGASNGRIIRQHILSNSVAPVIVVATIALGGYIGVEATLSFLGIGLPGNVVSWGGAIATASRLVRSTPHMLLFPSMFLSVTVLAFIMLGDAVRDALDPKLR
jgi:oligopeptide transport system permease protein